ncbi:MAG: hypothetical protein KJ804_16755 [Proteobacteria bacterium]|nr:hypothetical protein [Pseudomonadota bacterium]MBU1059959.1 hypothetical protein [Pseudomonadota bacterium]
MATHTQTTTRTQEDTGYETSKFALGVGISMAALVGLWGMTCLISALANVGTVNVLKNYFVAISG